MSLIFAALADPKRRQILAMLADGEKTVTQLAEPFRISQPAISKHLKVLERAGLIERGREAQWRPALLRAEPLREASAWMGQYRQHWEARFDQPDVFQESLQVGEQAIAGRVRALGLANGLKIFLTTLGKAIQRLWHDAFRL